LLCARTSTTPMVCRESTRQEERAPAITWSRANSSAATACSRRTDGN
jgi:hypothetical protein